MNSLKGKAIRLILKSGIFRLAACQNAYHILPYHMIADDPDPFYPQISKNRFERQIAQLAKHYTVMPLDALVEKARAGESVRRHAAITFDDGFRDNFDIALPILEKYGMSATIFLITGNIESQKAPWFIRFRYLFRETNKDRIDISLNGNRFSDEMRTPIQKKAVSDRIMSYFKTCPDTERLEILEELENRLGPVPDSPKLENIMLTWDHVKTMAERGIRFGAHTVRHPVMSRVPLPEAAREISDSKKMIESAVGIRVNTFAYPFGRKEQFTPELFALLEQEGFVCAVSTELGYNSPEEERFALRRNMPWDVEHVA